MDSLQSRMKAIDCRAKRRYRLHKAFHRLAFKVRSLTDEFHKKFVRWLADHYEYVIVPNFNAHNMCGKLKRKIGSKTVRSMLTWSHGRFRERLGKHDDVCVLECTEEYTSQACSKCSHLWKKIGGAKQYRCRNDQCVASTHRTKMDRDCNGAMNIFLKWVIDNSNPSLLASVNNPSTDCGGSVGPAPSVTVFNR